jgi:hypothetical protein
LTAWWTIKPVRRFWRREKISLGFGEEKKYLLPSGKQTNISWWFSPFYS